MMRLVSSFSVIVRSALVAGLLFSLASLSACAEDPVLLEGTITFDVQPETLVGATIYIRIFQDSGGSLQELQAVEQEVEEDVAGYNFQINGEDPPAGTYVLRVHVDTNSNGSEDAGDYVSGDIPVFNGTYPESVSVPVALVQ